MEDYLQDLLELEARFSTEAACREYLFRLRWPDGVFLSVLWQSEGLALIRRPDAVLGLQPPDFDHGRNDF
jgi:hypothetical protein